MALADFFTRPSSEAPAEGGLSPDLADRLEQAKAAYQKQYGKPMPITSGFRTKEEQQRLFDQRKANPNLVAAPGTSLHETGNAVDIGTTVPEAFLNQFGRMVLFPKYLIPAAAHTPRKRIANKEIYPKVSCGSIIPLLMPGRFSMSSLDGSPVKKTGSVIIARAM